MIWLLWVYLIGAAITAVVITASVLVTPRAIWSPLRTLMSAALWPILVPAFALAVFGK